MRDFYKLLDKFMEKQIYFDFQSHDNTKFYNFTVKDVHGKQHYFHYDNLDQIETATKVIWGHLLVELPSIPPPPGFL